MASHGSLICVGCGIKGVAHLTLETVGWIRSADVVCYCCSDPATVVWLRQNAAQSEDLAACYSEQRDRASIYGRMIDIMLSYVRANKKVCVVFYGHPGVFVYATHAAIAKARQEGFAAVMLPGVSAADCLFADLGVDPSQVGCLMYEATDLLLRRRTVAADAHLIVWQIGVVGNAGFRFGRYDNRNIGILVDYLESHYGGDHRVCHYQAAQFPMCSPVVEWSALAELERTCQISAISTLYVPPKLHKETDVALGEAIGYLQVTSVDSAPQLRVATPAVARSYVPMPEKSRLADFINRMAADPELLAEFQCTPEATCRREATLTKPELEALLSLDPGRLRVAIKNPPQETQESRASAASAFAHE